MNIHIRLFAITAITLLLASCNKKNTQGRYIPEKAALAITVDGTAMSSKLPWEEVKNNPLFQELYTDTFVTAAVKKLMDNPANSGIDVKKDLIFFIQKDETGGYVAFEGTISDEAAFRNMNAALTNGAGNTSEKNGVNFLSRSPMSVGWNKERFVYVFDMPQLSQLDELTRRMQRDSIDVTPRKPRDIMAVCGDVFNLPEDKSLAGNKNFTKLMKQTGDMHLWLNNEELNKSTLGEGMLSNLNLLKMYQGSVAGISITFDNGKINISALSFAGDELTKLYKKYSGGKINEDMLKRMPGKDVAAVLSLNFKPEGIREFLKLMNLDGFINMANTTTGFTLDDFVKANKGDIMIGVSDFKMEPDTSKYVYSDEETFGQAIPVPRPSFNMVFATTIGDKDAFNKLIKAGTNAGNAFLRMDAGEFAYNSNGTYFALGNSKDNIDKFFAGSNTTTPEYLGKLSGNAFGGYLNLQSIMKAFEPQATKDSSAKIIYDASLKMWDNVLMKGGEFSDGALLTNMEVNLVDKNSNSLKQINQYFYLLGQLAKEQQRKRKQDMMALEDAMNGVEGTGTDAPAEEKTK